MKVERSHHKGNVKQLKKKKAESRFFFLNVSPSPFNMRLSSKIFTTVEAEDAINASLKLLGCLSKGLHSTSGYQFMKGK